jgi:calcineurin-like phosphoesterase family protein
MAHWLCKIWPKSHYGSWHCHGHSHSGMDQYVQKKGKILDIGVDNISKYKSDFYGPISFEEI